MAKGPQFDYEEETPPPGKLLKLDPAYLIGRDTTTFECLKTSIKCYDSSIFWDSTEGLRD